MTLFSQTWAVFCAVSSGLFGEVLLSLQEDNWDTSKDERIQWRYQHAQAAVVNIVDPRAWQRESRAEVYIADPLLSVSRKNS